MLLVDPRVRHSIERDEDYGWFLYLDIPFAAAPEAWLNSDRFIPVGWPLTEQRLIRVLMARVLSGHDARPSDTRPTGI